MKKLIITNNNPKRYAKADAMVIRPGDSVGANRFGCILVDDFEITEEIADWLNTAVFTRLVKRT